MRNIVLTMNLGSTSLKVGIFDVGALGSYDDPLSSRSWPTEPARSLGESTSVLGDDSSSCGHGPDALVERVVKWVADQAMFPSIVVHRIVHGGTLRGPCLLNEASISELSALSDWAPSHQKGALDLVVAAIKSWPNTKNVALFDTDWHKTLPKLTQTLPLSAELRSRGLHRYGFHGIAFQSAWRQFASLCPDAMRRQVVFAHLGGGSSLCAVRGGKSIDTTMGLTPLDGLPMTTRCGSLDPGLILYLLKTGSFTPDSMLAELSERSGLQGISGLTGDMKLLLANDAQGALLAIDIFTHRTAQGIASMATTLQGIDDLVFSGGIGTHAPRVRAAIVDRLEWLGLKIDHVANEAKTALVSKSDSSVRIHVLEAAEDRELAAGAMEWL